MDPSPLQLSEIDSSSSPIPLSVTSVPDDERQTLTNSPKSSEQQQQNPPIQNPSSDTVQIPLPQAADPPNSEAGNPDHDLQQPEPEDPGDQEGMMLSPSHTPLISDANVDEERLSSPPSRSSRRPPHPRRGKRNLGKKKLAGLEKKSQALAKTMKSVPFVPSKALDFSKHEESLRKLGLWDFAHLEFDRKHLIKSQKEDLLKEKSPDEVEEIMVLKDDDEDEGDVKMVECDEVSHGGEPEMNLENVPATVEEGIGSAQSDVKMAENVDSVVEMGSVGDAGNVDSLGSGDGTRTTDLAVLVEIEKTSGDQGENLMVTGDQVESPNSTGVQVDSPKITTNQVENPKITSDQVETPTTFGDSLNTIVDHVYVENLETAVDRVENLETAAVDHVENLKPTAVDHVEILETVAVDYIKSLETAAVDHMKNLEPAVVDRVENLEPAAADYVEHLEITGDHVENMGSTGDLAENLKSAGDHVENLGSTGDPVENLKPVAADHVEYLEVPGEHVEDTEPTNDVEDMNIDGDHVEDKKDAVNVMEDITEADIVIPDDDAEIQETGCNELIDFEVCKVDEHDPWDLSSKEVSEQQHFLQHCTMSEPKLHEQQRHQENDSHHLAEELDDDDPEDDEPVQGFGLSSGHLMDSSQIGYSAFDSHVMLGGPSSIFGNSSKRELDLDPEIPTHSLNETHKRMRTEGSSWDKNPPEVDFCLDQMQQWMEKSKLAYITSQQTTMTQQQMLFNEIGSKDHLIQQLKMNNDELQRRRQAEISRYENELYAMNSIIDGYRKALKSIQQAFAEYRKRLPLPAEPLYKDAGEGGVVKSVAELAREQLRQEEKERAARIMVERFEKEWEMKFERYLDETEKFGARVCEIVKGVELLRGSIGKRKASSEMATFDNPIT
ncbi:hypothetical protein V2J09_002734 [Rumex salicifolius]